MKRSTLLLVGNLLLASALSGCSSPPAPGCDGPLEPVSSPDAIGAAVSVMLQHAVRTDTPLNVLAISGGGQNGAFGAGVLKGWRSAGRPDCQLVTGVSTGAFVATLAFLDTEDADELLRRMYTSTTRDDVLTERSTLGALFSDSFATNEGMQNLIGTYFTNEVIDRVAERSQNGARLLLVGTTNLDEGHLQLWNMSALARAKRYDCYRKVLLASGSIPVLFPPVSLGGAVHVDGGVRQHVFAPYGLLNAEQAEALRELISDEYRRKATVHVLVNSLVTMPEAEVEDSLLQIAARTVPTLLDSILIGNLWRLWGESQISGIGFRMLAIPDALQKEAASSVAFDPVAMRALFDHGEALGRDPAAWSDRPPASGFARSRERQGN